MVGHRVGPGAAGGEPPAESRQEQPLGVHRRRERRVLDQVRRGERVAGEAGAEDDDLVPVGRRGRGPERARCRSCGGRRAVGDEVRRPDHPHRQRVLATTPRPARRRDCAGQRAQAGVPELGAAGVIDGRIGVQPGRRGLRRDVGRKHEPVRQLDRGLLRPGLGDRGRAVPCGLARAGQYGGRGRQHQDQLAPVEQPFDRVGDAAQVAGHLEHQAALAAHPDVDVPGQAGLLGARRRGRWRAAGGRSAAG